MEIGCLNASRAVQAVRLLEAFPLRPVCFNAKKQGMFLVTVMDRPKQTAALGRRGLFQMKLNVHEKEISSDTLT